MGTKKTEIGVLVYLLEHGNWNWK